MSEIPQPTGGFVISASIGLGVLLAICAVLGLLARKKSSTFDSFLAGHGDIGPVITGLALSATWLSGWACLGMMGVTYTVGWSGMWFAGMWTIVGIIPCVLLTGLKMRQYSAEFGARTVPDVIGIRFDSRLAQSIAGIVMMLLMLLYAVGQYKAGATCWYAITGLPPFWCLALSAIVVLVYVMLGGYTGTQWSLALQGAILGIACFALGIAALVSAGGPGGMNAKLYAQDPNLLALMRSDLPTVGKTQIFSHPIGITATFFIFITMATGFPHNVARFLGMRKLTRRDFVIMVLVVFLVAGPPVFMNAITGLSARAIFGAKLLKITPWKGDLAAPYTAMTVGGIPLATLYIVGLFAAALSTLSAMLMVMAGNIAKDVVSIWKPQISQKSLFLLNRILLVVFALIPFYWTFRKPPALLAVFMGFAAIGLGGIFVFCTAVSFYWKRATKIGAILCMLYGVTATIVGGMLVSKSKIGMGTMEYMVLAGCAAFYFIGSFLSKPVASEKLSRLFPES